MTPPQAAPGGGRDPPDPSGAAPLAPLRPGPRVVGARSSRTTSSGCATRHCRRTSSPTSPPSGPATSARRSALATPRDARRGGAGAAPASTTAPLRRASASTCSGAAGRPAPTTSSWSDRGPMRAASVVLLDCRAAGRGWRLLPARRRGGEPGRPLARLVGRPVGDEAYRLRVRDTSTGEDVERRRHPHVLRAGLGARLASFLYTTIDHADRPHRVWRHRRRHAVLDRRARARRARRAVPPGAPHVGDGGPRARPRGIAADVGGVDGVRWPRRPGGP